MILVHPLRLLLLLILPILWFKLRNKQFVGLSDTRLAGRTPDYRFLHMLPLTLFTLAYTSLVIAVAQPQKSHQEGTDVVRSRDIIIAVDISASMDAGFEGTLPKPEKGNTELDKELPTIVMADDKEENAEKPRRIDAAQSAVTRFVRQRFLIQEGDRIGILAFDTVPRWSWPLTDDLKMIYRKGIFINRGLGGGTNFGDSIPGPIDAAAEHFDERGQATSKVMIMVTDGENYISTATMDRLHKLLTERGVRLYVIGVGETLAQNDVDIMRLADSVGGQVFRVENTADMVRCFDSISEMERSIIKVDRRIGYHDIFYYFVLAALGLMALSMLGEAIIVSR